MMEKTLPLGPSPTIENDKTLLASTTIIVSAEKQTSGMYVKRWAEIKDTISFLWFLALMLTITAIADMMYNGGSLFRVIFASLLNCMFWLLNSMKMQ